MLFQVCEIVGLVGWIHHGEGRLRHSPTDYFWDHPLKGCVANMLLGRALVPATQSNMFVQANFHAGTLSHRYSNACTGTQAHTIQDSYFKSTNMYIHMLTKCMYACITETTLHLIVMQNGTTPLKVASEVGHVEVVKMLADAGSDINFQDKVGHCRVCLMHLN